jgi:ribose transport system substrate-binding protein
MFPRRGEPDGDLYTTGLRLVVPDGRSPVRPELFDAKVVEYLELPAFKAWLAKYGLTSS